jgi:hypothetical protein
MYLPGTTVLGQSARKQKSVQFSEHHDADEIAHTVLALLIPPSDADAKGAARRARAAAK